MLDEMEGRLDSVLEFLVGGLAVKVCEVPRAPALTFHPGAGRGPGRSGVHGQGRLAVAVRRVARHALRAASIAGSLGPPQPPAPTRNWSPVSVSELIALSPARRRPIPSPAAAARASMRARGLGRFSLLFPVARRRAR